MEQDRQQGIGKTCGQGICQRGGHGHGHQQRGQRSGHGAFQTVGHQRDGGRTVVSNEVDHVVYRGLTMAEAAKLVNPNLKRSTILSSKLFAKKNGKWRMYTITFTVNCNVL